MSGIGDGCQGGDAPEASNAHDERWGSGWKSQPLTVQAVQCCRCGKYRRVPVITKYEQIRENIWTHPWECKFASEWNPRGSTCEDPDEFDSPEVLILHDVPGIPAPPPGWQRRCVLRSSASGFFGVKSSDVYYHPPDGSFRIDSKPKFEQYRAKNPGSVPVNFDVSKGISFQGPRAPSDMTFRRSKRKIDKFKEGTQ